MYPGMKSDLRPGYKCRPCITATHPALFSSRAFESPLKWLVFFWSHELQLVISQKHHIRYFGRFPVSQFNDSLGGVDLKCTQWVQFRSTQPKLYFPKILEFSHYNEYGVQTHPLHLWWLILWSLKPWPLIPSHIHFVCNEYMFLEVSNLIQLFVKHIMFICN